MSNIATSSLAGTVSLAALRSPALRAILLYWQSKKDAAGGHLPARRDLRPDEMLEFLRFVALINVYEQPRRFQFRLVGTGIADCMGQETTSMWVNEDLFADRTSEVAEFFSLAVNTGRPAYAQGLYEVRPSSRELKFDTVIAPLSSDGSRIDMLLGGLVGEKLHLGESIRRFTYQQISSVGQIG